MCVKIFPSAVNNMIPFEVVHKPWFGPRKRAREFLCDRRELLSPDQACQRICALAGNLSSKIQRIRFVDFDHNGDDDFRYTIALVWTYSDAHLRDFLYDNALMIVAETGWYPLPAGERIGSRLAERDFRLVRLSNAALSTLSIGGSLNSISSAVDEEGGCSIRCNTTYGSFLLDTGLPGKLSVLESDGAAFLSHSHLDHCGNINALFGCGLPVVMSRVTAQILIALGRVSEEELRKHCSFLDIGQELILRKGLTVSSFAIPHCPGSMGFTFNDGRSTLVYPGDVTFQTARHNAIPAIVEQCNSYPAKTRVCLIDGTMAGRNRGAGSHNVAVDTLKKLDQYQDIVILSTDAEQLLYAYLDLYHTCKDGQLRGTIEFVVSGKVKRIFQILHSNFIARNQDQIDPFIAAQYGRAMSSWAESRFLFWLDEVSSLSKHQSIRRIWFVTSSELADVRPIGKVGLIPMGRAVDTIPVASLPFARLEVDSSPWTLHSDEDCLQKVVYELEDNGVKVVLFHNFRRRLKKFAATRDLLSDALGQEPISII